MGTPDSSPAINDASLADQLSTLRRDPALWRTPDGRRLLDEARRRFSALAHSAGLDDGDGATHAWQFWTQDLTDAELAAHRQTIWAYTGGAIRRTMVKEDMAQRRLVSVPQLRHVVVEGLEAPVRFHSAVDLVEAWQPQLTIDPFKEDDTATTPAVGIGGRHAMSAIKQLLVVAGLTPTERELIIDEIAQRLVSSANVRAAADGLHRNPTPTGSALGLDRWRALVSLMLGTPKGTPGIIRLVGEGHPAPMAEPHIARLIDTFLSRPTISAAGVA